MRPKVRRLRAGTKLGGRKKKWRVNGYKYTGERHQTPKQKHLKAEVKTSAGMGR